VSLYGLLELGCPDGIVCEAIEPDLAQRQEGFEAVEVLEQDESAKLLGTATPMLEAMLASVGSPMGGS